MEENLREAALEILDSTPRVLHSLLSTLPAHLLERPADDDWSPKDVVAHLLVSQERGSFSRIRAIVESDQPALQNLDEQEELEHSGFRAWEAEALLSTLAVRRAEDVEWLRTLQPSALARVGLHSEVGPVTAEEFLYHAAYHDALHLRQFLGMLQSHLEPHRGRMRAFK
jgi:hypothetical protein